MFNDDHQEIRGDMIILILATDMARHAEILDNFKQKLDNFDYSSEDHLNTLKMILIKACDISNECRPIMVSEVTRFSLLSLIFCDKVSIRNRAGWNV